MSINPSSKILILRFSSLGDVLQTLSVAAKLKKLTLTQADHRTSHTEIHWATRQDLSPWVELSPDVDQVWKLDRSLGLKGVFQLAQQMSQQNFTHIYDAHRSLRSSLIVTYLQIQSFLRRRPLVILKRPKLRKERRLLLKKKWNVFPRPFSGQHHLLRPLKAWGADDSLPTPPLMHLSEAFQDFASDFRTSGQGNPTSFDFKSFIVLCPASAHPLKQWPLEHFKKLIELLPQKTFVAVAGPKDTFIQELEKSFPERVKAFAGELSPRDLTRLFTEADLVISNDSGLMHLAEQVGAPTIALMGPAPFGYPARPSTRILEKKLSCRPCSKHGQGPCTNPEFQACLQRISPEEVAVAVQGTISTQSSSASTPELSVFQTSILARLFYNSYNLASYFLRKIGWIFFKVLQAQSTNKPKTQELGSTGKFQKFLESRFGSEAHSLANSKLESCIWVHFSSGEFLYARSVIEKLLAELPSENVLVTYFSPSAKWLLDKFLASLNPSNQKRLTVRVAPWDQRQVVQAFLDQFQPKCLLIARSDLWPAMILETFFRQIPILDFSAQWTKKFKISQIQSQTKANGKAHIKMHTKVGVSAIFYRALIRHLDSIHCVTGDDANEFSALLGSPNGLGSYVENSRTKLPKISAQGDTRAESLAQKTSFDLKELYTANGQLEIKTPFRFIWASTWPKDEEVLHEFLSKKGGLLASSQIYWAPHEPQPQHREMAQKFSKTAGLPLVVWSENLLQKKQLQLDRSLLPFEPAFVFIDTVGHLFELYKWMDLAFVGGSFQSKVHNVLEPLAWGTPVLTGPKIQNSREALQLAKDWKTTEGNSTATGVTLFSPVLSVPDATELLDKVDQFFSHHSELKASIQAQIEARKTYRQAFLNLSGGISSAVEWVKSKIS